MGNTDLFLPYEKRLRYLGMNWACTCWVLCGHRGEEGILQDSIGEHQTMQHLGCSNVWVGGRSPPITFQSARVSEPQGEPHRNCGDPVPTKFLKSRKRASTIDPEQTLWPPGG
jgi:hypothetical protein